MTLRERFDNQLYVSVKEYAQKLAVSERAVYLWVRKGAIPAKRVGRTIRIQIVFSAAPPSTRPSP